MNCFVRQSFYITPPSENASVSEWRKWIKKDAYKARADKARFTKELEQADVPDFLQSCVARKIDGVWRQSVAVGLVGSIDNDTMGVEPVVKASQEKDTIIESWSRGRGSKSHGRSKRRNRNRRRAK